MSFNTIDLCIALIFLMPIITGIVSTFSQKRVMYSISSAFENLELAAAMLIAFYLTGRIFFSSADDIFKRIYDWIPMSIKQFLLGRDLLIYMLAVPLLLVFILGILRLVTGPIYKRFVIPLSRGVYKSISSMHTMIQRMIGGIWKLPRSVWLALVFALALNFASYFIDAPSLGKMLSDSVIYKAIYDNALSPVLNSSLAKKIPVLFNDSFRRPAENAQPDRPPVRIIEYFNGVTLDEAVKSNQGIDTMAVSIVGAEENDGKKAYLIYQWIASNIKYDFEKAERISTDPFGISSGSIIAFNTRKGVCFDYSCLYVSMCRAVGLKVRLVTGLGFSGNSWGDHSWNQAYYPAEDRWINVDATFGSSGMDYFDKQDFTVDHKYADVQGEW